MNLLNVNGNDLFELENVTSIADANGKKRICCNYVLFKGYKNCLKITFEGYADKNTVRIKSNYKFKSLMNMFSDRRVYLQGVCFLDNQFETPDANKAV